MPRPSLPTPPVSAAPLRVLVADDHLVVRDGLATIINQQPDFTVVAEAADGHEAVALWREHQPDLGLIDLKMPGLDGVGAVCAIRARHPGARVLILTTLDSEEDIFRAVQAGARGYLLKDCRREELLDALRRVARGERVLDPVMAGKLAARLAAPAPTARELEVLQLTASGKTNKEIAASLHLSEPTVKAHLKSLFVKLDVLSRTEAVNVALRRGLIRVE